MCPGTSLALKTVHAMFGAMIQCFEWKAGKDGNLTGVDMDKAPGLNIPRANPLRFNLEAWSVVESDYPVRHTLHATLSVENGELVVVPKSSEQFKAIGEATTVMKESISGVFFLPHIIDKSPNEIRPFFLFTHRRIPDSCAQPGAQIVQSNDDEENPKVVIELSKGHQVNIEENIIIKAKCEKGVRKFRLSMPVTPDVEIARSFVLETVSYSLKYLDEDNDWILLTYEEEMQECIESSRRHY
ncbi:hypothetical protein L1987_46272 [Smallanthus sonchifolius]|uniref:Uncharacterized protein n=1 Tax=Smallanthus sonchifolius TaxID=185202 RepID=A0ACB9G114_9ASTR|nr:hypothetical protein L1987_46272 [Smallanthus sonchifolius]